MSPIQACLFQLIFQIAILRQLHGVYSSDFAHMLGGKGWTSHRDLSYGQLRCGNYEIVMSGTTYEAWRDCSTTYVHTTQDRWLPPECQDSFLANATDAGVAVEVSIKPTTWTVSKLIRYSVSAPDYLNLL
ncbi:hypothetical protein GGR53DRAFT_35317 [Hypoxylon sp. FL1150]|nr:hypothetical protein GGR53DRAFT_35317 [Hypoxylon sp. FL1150]